MVADEDRIRPADAAILDHLAEQRFDYAALVARDQQLPPAYAERRIERLETRDLVEAVSSEAVYRITERGQRRLAAYREARDEVESPQVTGDA